MSTSHRTPRLDPPLCVALDAAEMDRIRNLLDQLTGIVPVFKVGLELFCAHVPSAVRAALDTGAEVFLDLKINDIPRTTAGAVAAAKRLGANYLTVQGNAGRAVLRAALEAAGADGPKILVVSVLTSLDADGLAETGVSRDLGAQVLAMAGLATQEGAAGLVLSPREVTSVRIAHPDLFLVTPGVRPSGSAVGDQSRVDTPSAAISSGSDLLVVGRPITQAPDPAKAAAEVVEEIRAASVQVAG